MIEEMVSRGEITDSGVADALVSLLNKAQIQYENDRSSAKNMLMAAVNLINAQTEWRKSICWPAAQKLGEYINDIIVSL